MVFIQHIPQAMLQSIGFMALLFLLIEGLCYLKKTTANQKYWLAVIFYAIALIQFIVNLFVSKNTDLPQRIIPIADINKVQWLTYIGALYLIVLALYVVNFLVQWMKLLQVKTAANYETNHVLIAWMETKIQAIGDSRKVHLGFTNHLEGPVTFGWMEPIILLPFAMLNQLSTEEIKFILLHEIAHIIRRDFIIHIIVEIAQMILCFNPFSYYFSKIIQVEREKACDGWVVENTQAPLPYTKALYQLAKFNYKHQNKLSLAAGEKSSALLDRIQYINGLNPTLKSSKSLLFKGLFGIAFAFLFLFNLDQQGLNNIQSKKLNLRSSVALSTTVMNNMKSIQLANDEYIEKTSHILAANTRPKKISKLNIHADVSLNNNKSNAEDSIAYNELVQSTIAWIKAREGNQDEQAVLANFSDKVNPFEYTVAEQLMLRAVLHNYALKRAILANKMLKADNQDAAMTLIRDSKEWKALQQYEKWARHFLQKHPIIEDTTKKENDF